MANFCSQCGASLGSSSKAAATPSKTAKQATAKKPRKPTAYNKRYSKAFKKHSPRFKKKSGGWKKDGYRSAVRAAHKEAGR
jgi:hypothetical protein